MTSTKNLSKVSTVVSSRRVVLPQSWKDFEKIFAFYAPCAAAKELLPHFDAFCRRLKAIHLRAVDSRFSRALMCVATWVDWYQEDIARATDLTTFNRAWHTHLLTVIAPTWSAYPNIKIFRNALIWIAEVLHSGRYGDEPTFTPNPRKDFQAALLRAVNVCEPSLRAAWKLGLQRLALEDTRLDDFFADCHDATFQDDSEALRQRLPALPKKIAHFCDFWLDLYVDGGKRTRLLSDPMGDFMTPAERFWLDDLALLPIEKCTERELHLIFNSYLLPGGTVRELLPYFYRAIERLCQATPCQYYDAFAIISGWLLYWRDDIQAIADWETLVTQWISALLQHGETVPQCEEIFDALFEPIELYEELPWYASRMEDFLRPLFANVAHLSPETRLRLCAYINANLQDNPYALDISSSLNS